MRGRLRAESELAWFGQDVRERYRTQAFGDGFSQRHIGGSIRPFIEAPQVAVSDECLVDGGHLHEGEEILGRISVSAKDVFEPDPIVFLRVEIVLNPMAFPARVGDDLEHSVPGDEEIGREGIERAFGGFGAVGALGVVVLTGEDGRTEVVAQLKILDPAEVAQSMLMVLSRPHP